MTTLSQRAEAFFLFVGDVGMLYGSLFVMLLIRYGTSVFHFKRMLSAHIVPFSILFILSALVFFIAGLYEKHTLFLQKQLPQLLSRALSANVIIAVLFFYFIPAFKITPKGNLFIYLFVSSIALYLWRRYRLSRNLGGERERAVIIGQGEEMERIKQEINNNSLYRMSFVLTLDSSASGILQPADVARKIREEHITLVVSDLTGSGMETLLPPLYELLISGVRFMDMHEMYEEMFDSVPLALTRGNWFLSHFSSVASRFTYDFLKRVMDIALSLPLLIISLLVYPVVFLLIAFDDGGKFFVSQERVGQGGKTIRTIKFRTMSRDDRGLPELKVGNKVTRVGAFLRRTRIDELPQLWNVLLGEMSLIGPRPELPSLVAVYEKEVPYYNIRHLIKPGLSGWAQLYHKTPPKVDANPDETATKLSYDLYYLKNRSFWLDVKIALKTIKVLLSRSGV